MTVRAWFTISAVALVALGVAFAVWAFRPIQPPEMLARVGEQRFDGVHTESCWPQGDGELRCVDPEDDLRTLDAATGEVVPKRGTLEVRAAYPVQPDDGSIRILDLRSGDVVERAGYTDELAYSLEPGSYLLEVRATYSGDAYVEWTFPFRIR